MLFLALAVRGIQLPELLAALGQVNYLWLVPATLALAAAVVTKGFRWQWLFLPEHRLPYWPLVSSLLVGYMASNVLPARPGEVVRLILVSGEFPVSPARVLSTIVIERLLDVLSLLILLGLTLPFLPVELPVWMQGSAQALGIGSVLAAAAMILLSRSRVQVVALLRRLLRPVRFLDRPAVYSTVDHVLAGFGALRGGRGVALVAISLVSWLASLAMSWMVAQAFHMDVPFTALSFTLVVTTLGQLLPSTPGYVGVFHALAVLALTPFGVPKDLALSYALVLHGATYVLLTLWGAMALWARGVSLGQLLKHRPQVAPVGEPAERVDGD